jgi:hypothetical protein
LDLACSKLVAGRPKDIEFVGAMLAHTLIEGAALESQIALLPESAQRQAAVKTLRIVASKSDVDD